MPFSELLNDTIDLLQKDGAKWLSLKASVQKNKIFMMAGDVRIRSGDLIQRNMSNGDTETYEVIDPGFVEGVRGIPRHYQMDVKKLGAPEAAKAVQHITYNISGHNTRINQNSVDNSTNVVNVDSKAFELLANLRAEVSALKLSPSEEKEAMEVIDAVQSQIQSGKPQRGVVAALLNALPQVANVATIISALMPLVQAAS